MTKQFSTTDVYLTAALSSVGLRPDKITVADARMTFYWSSAEARTMAEKYYSKNLQVDARTYADEVRGVKTVIHNPTV